MSLKIAEDITFKVIENATYIKNLPQDEHYKEKLMVLFHIFHGMLEIIKIILSRETVAEKLWQSWNNYMMIP